MEFALWALALVIVPLVGAGLYWHALTHVGGMETVNTDDWTSEEFTEDGATDTWQ